MDNFAREIDRGLRRRGPGLLRKGMAVFLALSLFPPGPAAHAAEFEIAADSFTVVNQVNISSVTYYQTRAIVPPDPSLATQLLTPGGLYFDATYYNVWDRNALSWVKLATGTVEAGRVAKAGDFMSGQLTTASTLTVQGNAFSVGGSTFVVAGGNVGIGTAVPGAKLEVSGDIKLSGGAPTHKISNVANPTANSDVATKSYVDAAGARRYYLTTTLVFGAGALTACAPGFHFASFWEIFNTTILRYDTSLGQSRPDSGRGPPHSIYGWIRTGGYSNNGCDTNANCALWSSTTPGECGLAVALSAPTNSPGIIPSPWQYMAFECGAGRGAWCVED